VSDVPTPEFIVSLRAKVGHDLLVVPTVAVIARDAEGRLLLVKDRDTGLWGCPGGIVEPHEFPSDAAVRETWEEAHVLVALTRIAGVFGGERCHGVYPNGDRLAWVATVFCARVLEGTASGDGIETLDAQFYPADALADLPLKDSTRMFLQAGTGSATSAYFMPSTWKPS
jgi:ADP-ribose pyrophosphatase YjhB (NUDIX family)